MSGIVATRAVCQQATPWGPWGWAGGAPACCSAPAHLLAAAGAQMPFTPHTYFCRFIGMHTSGGKQSNPLHLYMQFAVVVLMNVENTTIN
eukprot:6183397-Pleurochrysis_carterae.AAC.3